MMTKNPDVSKRWTAFQCPSCFGLFRIQKFNLGKKGVCPLCRCVILVPAARAALAPTPRTHHGQRSEPDEALLEKLAVAKTLTPEELEQAAVASSRQRRKVFSGGESDTLDWEEAAEKNSPEGVSGYLIGVIAMFVVLVAAGGIYYIQTAPAGKPGSGTMLIGDAASNLALEESLKIAGNEEDEEDRELVDKIDDFAKFDLQAIEDVVRAFLQSSSVEERLKWVRQPERVEPLMINHYDGEEIVSEGFRSYDRNAFSYQGNFITLLVRTNDFKYYDIKVDRQEEEGEVKYRVDWESWSGYCEITPEEARVQKPTEPFLMRVYLTPKNYFNYAFSDDTKWNSYRMTFGTSNDAFQAYTEKKSAPAKALASLYYAERELPFTVRVRFPEGSRAANQVEIVEVLEAGWVLNAGDETK